jgi:hypothetical protein
MTLGFWPGCANVSRCFASLYFAIASSPSIGQLLRDLEQVRRLEILELAAEEQHAEPRAHEAIHDAMPAERVRLAAAGLAAVHDVWRRAAVERVLPLLRGVEEAHLAGRADPDGDVVAAELLDAVARRPHLEAQLLELLRGEGAGLVDELLGGRGHVSARAEDVTA